MPPPSSLRQPAIADILLQRPPEDNHTMIKAVSALLAFVSMWFMQAHTCLGMPSDSAADGHDDSFHAQLPAEVVAALEHMHVKRAPRRLLQLRACQRRTAVAA